MTFWMVLAAIIATSFTALLATLSVAIIWMVWEEFRQ